MLYGHLLTERVEAGMDTRDAGFHWSRPANMVWWGVILLVCGGLASQIHPALIVAPLVGVLLLLAGLIGLAVRGRQHS